MNLGLDLMNGGGARSPSFITGVTYSSNHDFGGGYNGNENTMRDGVFDQLASIRATTSSTFVYIMASFDAPHDLTAINLACIAPGVPGWGPAYTNNRELQYSTLEAPGLTISDLADWTTIQTISGITNGVLQENPVELSGVRHVRVLHSGTSNYVGLGDFSFKGF